MKLKFFKPKWIIVTVIIVIISSLIAISSFSGNLIAFKSSTANGDEILEELSNIPMDELCNEINILSDNGTDLGDLMYHSIAFVNKINSITNEELIDIISNENNSSNLRIIAIQAIDFIGNGKKINVNNVIKDIVLDKKADTNLRQNAVWLLDSSDESYDILEEVIYQKDEKLAFQALKKLNNEAPERALKIANTLIENKEENEKLRIAIKVISLQMVESEDIGEKDKWVSYCIKVFDKAISENNESMSNTVIFALSDMHYEKALYEIIKNEKVDDAMKKFCIMQNYQVIINVLENNPSKEDIGMAIEAMTLIPIDKTVYVLENVVKNSKDYYDLEPIFSQEIEKAIE